MLAHFAKDLFGKHSLANHYQNIGNCYPSHVDGATVQKQDTAEVQRHVSIPDGLNSTLLGKEWIKNS